MISERLIMNEIMVIGMRLSNEKNFANGEIVLVVLSIPEELVSTFLSLHFPNVKLKNRFLQS